MNSQQVKRRQLTDEAGHQAMPPPSTFYFPTCNSMLNTIIFPPSYCQNFLSLWCDSCFNFSSSTLMCISKLPRSQILLASERQASMHWTRPFSLLSLFIWEDKHIVSLWTCVARPASNFRMDRFLWNWYEHNANTGLLPTFISNTVVEWLTLLRRIWEVSGLHPSLKPSYPEGGYLWLSSVPPGKWWDITMTASFQIFPFHH
jgi:hypothetical protein